MKINIIGLTGCAADHLAIMLNHYSQTIAQNSPNTDRYDINLQVGLWKRKYPEAHNLVAYPQGTDVLHDFTQHKKWFLKQCDLILYSNPEMPKITRIPGEEWHLPYNTKMFDSRFYDRQAWPRTKDVIFYCSRLDNNHPEKVIEYAENHPQQKCTVLGTVFPATLMGDIPNLDVIEKVPYATMPQMYARHKKYIRWTEWDGNPGGVSTYEALAMGLEAYWNNKQITETPDYMKMEVAIPRLLKMFKQML